MDDIFVEGSLRDAVLSPAMTFTGGRVSVTVQFQRTCDANYYGVSCFTYCVPANNDADGHFTCDASDGSKLCLPGYSNPDNNCRDGKLQFVTSPFPVLMYFSISYYYYFSFLVSIDINDCASGPCRNGGNCTVRIIA